MSKICPVDFTHRTYTPYKSHRAYTFFPMADVHVGPTSIPGRSLSARFQINGFCGFFGKLSETRDFCLRN